MAAPRLTWTNETLQTVTEFDLGVVDAGSSSPDFVFYLWNNKRQTGTVDPTTGREYGATDISDVEDLTITTRHIDGGTSNEVVLGQWLRVCAPTQDGTNFTPVGYDSLLSKDVRHSVGSSGTTRYAYDDAPTTLTESQPNLGNHISENGVVSLLGVANDGTLENSGGNYIKLVFRATVPPTATAGIKQFLTRASYKYV